MAENSKIEWCDHTVNLWWGCSKVHTGCKNCYAETTSKRFGDDIWGENKNRKRIKSAFNDLYKYQKQAEKAGKRVKVFVGSMMDIFEDNKPLLNENWRMDFYSTDDLRMYLYHEINLGKYPNLIFLFLTKRPQNIPHHWQHKSFNNVWFGTSISDQKTANELIPKLQKVNGNKFLSIEPQIGNIELKFTIECHSLIDIDHTKGINWIIQGGESGHKKRPFNLDWARSMREQCKKASIPYFFKQIDKIQPIPSDLMVREFPNL